MAARQTEVLESARTADTNISDGSLSSDSRQEYKAALTAAGLDPEKHQHTYHQTTSTERFQDFVEQRENRVTFGLEELQRQSYTTSSSTLTQRDQEQRMQIQEASSLEISQSKKNRRKSKRGEVESIEIGGKRIPIPPEVLDRVEGALEQTQGAQSGLAVSKEVLQSIATTVIRELQGKPLNMINSGDLQENENLREFISKAVTENFTGPEVDQLAESLEQAVEDELLSRAVSSALVQDKVDTALLLDALRRADFRQIQILEQRYQSETGSSLMLELGKRLDPEVLKEVEVLLRDEDAAYDAMVLAASLDDPRKIRDLYSSRSSEEIKAFEEKFNQNLAGKTIGSEQYANLSEALAKNLSTNDQVYIDALRSNDPRMLEIIRWHDALHANREEASKFVNYFKSLSPQQQHEFVKDFDQVFKSEKVDHLANLDAVQRSYCEAVISGDSALADAALLALSKRDGTLLATTESIFEGSDRALREAILARYAELEGHSFEQLAADIGRRSGGGDQEVLNLLSSGQSLTNEQELFIVDSAIEQYANARGVLLAQEQIDLQALEILDKSFQSTLSKHASAVASIEDGPARVVEFLRGYEEKSRAVAVQNKVYGLMLGIAHEEKLRNPDAYELERRKAELGSYLASQADLLEKYPEFSVQLAEMREGAGNQAMQDVARAEQLATQIDGATNSRFIQDEKVFEILTSESAEMRQLILSAYRSKYGIDLTETEKFKDDFQGFKLERFQNLVENNTTGIAL